MKEIPLYSRDGTVCAHAKVDDDGVSTLLTQAAQGGDH